MMKEKIWRGIKLEDVVNVAEDITQWLQEAPTVWCFYGPMGAGKTTIIKSICQAVGVQDLVQSPTFSLVNEYSTAGGETVYHFDFYRIEKPEEAEGIGVAEYFDSGTLCLIEWPERVAPLLPEEYVQLQVQPQPDNSRTIQLTIHGTTH